MDAKRKATKANASLKVIKFAEDEFGEIVSAFYRDYPGHWVAMEMSDEQDEHGRRSGRVIANTPFLVAMAEAARKVHESRPQAIIKVFTTNMGAPRNSLRP